MQASTLLCHICTGVRMMPQALPDVQMAAGQPFTPQLQMPPHSGLRALRSQVSGWTSSFVCCQAVLVLQWETSCTFTGECQPGNLPGCCLSCLCKCCLA